MSFSPKHILIPVAIDPDDDLALAEYAVVAACDIAEKFQSKLTLLHLVPSMSAGGGASVDISGKIYQSFVDVLKTRLARGREKLKELQKAAEDRGIAVEGRVVDSLDDTADVIVDTADELHVDLVVIGSHGRSGLSKVFFGSVAEKVLEKASMPVLLLHSKDEKKSRKK